MARALPQGAALVEIALFRPPLWPSAQAPRPEATAVAWGDPRYAAFVLRGGSVTAIDLGPAAAVDAAVSRLGAALADPDLSHDPKPAAADAFARVLAPMTAALGPAPHVLYSPDGALALRLTAETPLLRAGIALAGAETLVMSLWQVDSGRTRELMAAYYGDLAAGAGRSEAMRRAQLGMLGSKTTAHPNVWASFIVSGRWFV